jgi:hypothetical protein
MKTQTETTALTAGSPTLSGGQAMLLNTMRRNILAILSDTTVFDQAECQRCRDNVQGCQCVARLQRWFRNVYRVRNERELAQTVAQRAARGRTADYAAELAHEARHAAFTAETGLTYSDLAHL